MDFQTCLVNNSQAVLAWACLLSLIDWVRIKISSSCFVKLNGWRCDLHTTLPQSLLDLDFYKLSSWCDPVTTQRFQRGGNMKYSQDQTQNFNLTGLANHSKGEKWNLILPFSDNSVWESHSTEGRDVIILSGSGSHYIFLVRLTAWLTDWLTVLVITDVGRLTSQWQLTWRDTLRVLGQIRERERERTNSPPGPHHTLPVFSVVVIICSSPSTGTTTDYLISSYQLFTLDEFFIVCLKSSKIPVWRCVLRLSESVLVCRGDSEEVWATFHTEFWLCGLEEPPNTASDGEVPRLIRSGQSCQFWSFEALWWHKRRGNIQLSVFAK